MICTLELEVKRVDILPLRLWKGQMTNPGNPFSISLSIRSERYRHQRYAVKEIIQRLSPHVTVGEVSFLTPLVVGTEGFGNGVLETYGHMVARPPPKVPVGRQTPV